MGVVQLVKCLADRTIMGRGISELQRWILKKALEKKRAHEPLICSAIKHEFYGMPWIHPTRGLAGWKFERRKLKNYNAVSAAISKAIYRLKARGLITITRSERSVERYRPPPESLEETERRVREPDLDFENLLESMGYHPKRRSEKEIQDEIRWMRGYVTVGPGRPRTIIHTVSETPSRTEMRLTAKGTEMAQSLVGAKPVEF
jgi:DNA-binding PadR family transcriptional regulator